jgi:hypothetical protein
MEALIQQAFLHVDVIGQHVHEGHYDLIGPDGEIILPQVWETMIKPDTMVEMKMWPMPERRPPPPEALPPPPMLPPPPQRGKSGSKGRKGRHDLPSPPMLPPPPPMEGMLPPPPPMPGRGGPPPPPPGVFAVGPDDLPPPPQALGGGGGHKEKKKKKSQPTGFLMWTAGTRAREQALKSAKKLPESAGSGAPKQAKAPASENGKPGRPSAPNGKAEKRTSWFSR